MLYNEVQLGLNMIMEQQQIQDLSSLSSLVSRLKKDIAIRGLRAGDRYLTNVEVCQLYGVSTTMADRAMRQLAGGKYLIRQRGNGTFIGQGVNSQSVPEKLKKIVILQPSDTDSLFLNKFLNTQLIHTGDYGLQINFVPAVKSYEYVKSMLSEFKKASDIKGIIAISFENDVYRILAKSSLPAVVVGSVEDDSLHLPYVDIDYRQGGSLITEHLIKKGHRKIGVILGAPNRAGTYHLCDGIMETLALHNLPVDSLVIRFYNYDMRAFEARLRNMFSSDNPPTALITQGMQPARDSFMITQRTGFAELKEEDIGFVGIFKHDDYSKFVCAVPKYDIFEYLGKILNIFDELKQGESIKIDKQLIPVSINCDDV